MRLFLFPFFFFSFVSSSLFGKRLVIQTRNSPWIFLRGNGDYRAEANNFGGEGRGGEGEKGDTSRNFAPVLCEHPDRCIDTLQRERERDK